MILIELTGEMTQLSVCVFRRSRRNRSSTLQAPDTLPRWGLATGNNIKLMHSNNMNLKELEHRKLGKKYLS